MRGGDRTTTYDGSFRYEYYDDSHSEEDVESQRHTSRRPKAKQLRGHGHSIAGRSSGRDESRRSRSPDGSRKSTPSDQASPVARDSPTRVDTPSSPPRSSFSAAVRSAVVTNEAKERLAASAGLGVPKVAFLRVNIMDIPHYEGDAKEAIVKLYIDVSWRARDMERHLRELQSRQPEGSAPSNKWSNTDSNSDNMVPKAFYQHCPIEFPGVGQKHHVSNLVENHVVAEDIEQWDDWFEMDPNSEDRFLTMDPPERLDPGGIGKDTGMRWLSYRGLGTIKLRLTDLNLRAYPFDTQTINVTVWHKNDWELKPSRCCAGVSQKSRSYASTFDQKMLEASMEGFICSDKVPDIGQPGYPHKWMPSTTRKAHDRVRPALTIGVRMSRRPHFYYFNYFGPLFVIGNLTGVALIIPPDDLATRAQIILTLILTLVAFKMTISQMLPRLPYPTILDK